MAEDASLESLAREEVRLLDCATVMTDQELNICLAKIMDRLATQPSDPLLVVRGRITHDVIAKRKSGLLKHSKVKRFFTPWEGSVDNRIINKYCGF